MQIRILGCSGGIGPGLRTTSLLVDGHLLIDAGTGVGDLPATELAAIDTVLLTHAHLDHVCGLAFMADNLFGEIDHPLVVHAIPETLAVLRDARATVIIVTHDPEEAMRLSDRIALLRKGELVQLGPPEELYRRPADRSVASLTGAP